MLFDASLLGDVLPFPPSYPGGFHDFWIARVAMALGTVSYVDRPLDDYVQHDGQALGATATTPDALRASMPNVSTSPRSGSASRGGETAGSTRAGDARSTSTITSVWSS